MSTRYGAGGGRRRAGRDGLPSDDLSGGEPPGDPEQSHGNPESTARTICLQQLTSRARSRAELAAVLAKRGVPSDAAGRVLDRFVEVGLIDDQALAQSIAGAQFRERGLAPRAVAMKLRRRGLDDDVIGQAVATIDAESERERARELVQRRAIALQDLDPTVRARRIFGLLARKGYSPALAYELVRELADSAD